MEIYCTTHERDVETEDTGGLARGATIRGFCPEDGGHTVEVDD